MSFLLGLFAGFLIVRVYKSCKLRKKVKKYGVIK